VFILFLGKGGRLRANGQGQKVFERADINFESILDISIHPFSISLNVSFGIYPISNLQNLRCSLFDRCKQQGLFPSTKL
jgi:hypothetical protein